jgi:hypothetical protein
MGATGPRIFCGGKRAGGAADEVKVCEVTGSARVVQNVREGGRADRECKAPVGINVEYGISTEAGCFRDVQLAVVARRRAADRNVENASAALRIRPGDREPGRLTGDGIERPHRAVVFDVTGQVALTGERPAHDDGRGAGGVGASDVERPGVGDRTRKTARTAEYERRAALDGCRPRESVGPRQLLRATGDRQISAIVTTLVSPGFA